MNCPAGRPGRCLRYTWPALYRPVWYLFEAPGKDAGGWSETGKAAAVVGLPNPFVLFAGEMAIVWSAFAGVVRRARAPLIIVVAFFAQWLPWAINPKGLEFYYYFYPSIVCLGPALALVAATLRRPWRDVFVWATLAASGQSHAAFFLLKYALMGLGLLAYFALRPHTSRQETTSAGGEQQLVSCTRLTGELIQRTGGLCPAVVSRQPISPKIAGAAYFNV